MHPKRPSSDRKTTRRECLARLVAAGLIGGTAGRLGAASGPASEPTAGKEQRVLLSPEGGDRATAYVMSNKLARRNGHLVCTWLDVRRQNRWALVDPERGKILRSGSVGEPRTDNHCGAAVATDVDGTLHLLVGAHGGTFVHYRMLPDRQEWEPVEDGRAVGRLATYPSLVCDCEGTLHLTYRVERGGRDPQLYYCRRPKQGPWSEPHMLVRLAVSEHSWLTNAIEVGESGRRLHVVFSNILPVPSRGPEARYYGASHIYSDDAGQTWRQFGDSAPLALPADAARLKRIEGSEMAPERIEAQYRYGGPLALTSYYHKMVLSNPVVNQQGQPWVIVHNLLAGDAQLCRYEEQGQWIGTPLLEPVRSLLPGYRIQHCGQLARREDGSIEAVLMVSPKNEMAWGAPGTTLVRLVFDAHARVSHKELVSRPEPHIPQWLPSLERWCPHAPVASPALLYTRGINAGGGKQNVNDVRTEVWLRVRESP